MLGSWRWLPRVGVVRAYTIHQSRGNILEIEVNFSDLLEFPKCDFGFQRGRKKFRENFAGHRKKTSKTEKSPSSQPKPTQLRFFFPKPPLVPQDRPSSRNLPANLFQTCEIRLGGSCYPYSLRDLFLTRIVAFEIEKCRTPPEADGNRRILFFIGFEL